MMKDFFFFSSLTSFPPGDQQSSITSHPNDILCHPVISYSHPSLSNHITYYLISILSYSISTQSYPKPYHHRRQTDAQKTPHHPYKSIDEQSQSSLLIIQSQSAEIEPHTHRLVQLSVFMIQKLESLAQLTHLTESCMVLQMCSRALSMTGSLVGSCWCLNTGE